MTHESAVNFILGATNEVCDAEDSRITGLFGEYAKKDPKILEREEFFTFYYTAAKAKIERVHDNLRNHFIRTDLKKISEVMEDITYDKKDMPRFTISANQSQFNKLMSLLNRNDETSPDVWNLIRSLSTNQELYQQVLSLSEAKNEQGEIDWKKFFEGSSRYKQIYNLEIIEELMQDGSSMEGDKRVAQVDNQNKSAKPSAASADGNETTASSATDANVAGNAEQQ